MTNPNNIVRLHSRTGGRGSVFEANLWAQVYDNGILTGSGVTAAGDLSVTVGGSASCPDVIIALNPADYKIALDLVGEATLTLTAPSSNSKICAIVAYTDDLALQSSDSTTPGNPSSCGLIVVNGTAAASPTAPTDTQIRDAITADGATGSQATYAIIAFITLSSTTTVITDTFIDNQQAFFEKLVPKSADPGEGVPLAPNHFISVYKES